MKIAISPCPNDTYLFYAWIAGLLKFPAPEVVFADIESLNNYAISDKFDLLKISIAHLTNISHKYDLLPVGAALGINCGPKIIAKRKLQIEKCKRIAIPGKTTTAHILLNRFFPAIKEKIFCRYNDVTKLIEEEAVDCGVIIHETRFTFEKVGLVEIVDLGKLWTKETNLPLPLGGLVIRKSYPNRNVIIETIRESLKYAKTHPSQILEFMLIHSQEKEEEIIKKHLSAYVNDETENISEMGIKSIKLLCQK